MRLAMTVCCAAALAACGDQAPSAADRGSETLLARAGDAVLAVDTGSGKMRRTPAGAHDAGWRAVYTARSGEGAARTVVTATDPRTGRELRSTQVQGHWTIPVAAGTTPEGAVSGDGRWLVLQGAPDRGVSEFALLSTRLDAPPRRFRLKGRFDFDALDPHASAIFLSQIERSGRYRVRAFDVRRQKLRPQVIVEKTSIGTIMQGVPVARAVDPSGSPVHTLYRGGPVGAFVHSLDTASGTALCILIPRSRRAGPQWRLRLDAGQDRLHALNPRLGAHYLIDPRSGEVTDAPVGTELPGRQLAAFAVSPDGALTAGGRRIGELGADAELLAVR